MARVAAVGTAAGLVLATAGAGPASAHTAATCMLSAGQIRCLGTISDYSVSPAPNEGAFTISSGQGRISFGVDPLVMIFSSTIQVDGRLVCAPELAGTGCEGRGQAGDDAVLISTVGTGDGSSAMVSLRDAAPASVAEPTPTTRGRCHQHGRRHHRRAHVRHHRRKHA
jgi:hypothetical protein